MFEHKPVRLRRFAAFLIDFHVILISAFTMAILAPLFLRFLGFYFAMFCAVSAIGYLYCRDWLLGGQSIGKRLCGLSVVDLATDGPSTGKQLLQKNLCYLIFPFDAFVLLLTGRSVGERISSTAVVPERYPAPIITKRLLRFAAVVMALGLALGTVASYGVKQSKENESYALALEYLSEKGFGSDFVLTGFSSESINGERSHSYTFQGLWTVTCHRDSDGTWSVCESCSDID